MSNRPAGDYNISNDIIPDRERMKVLSDMFDRFLLKDQQGYYDKTIDRYRRAAREVNWLRAFFAFLGGIASAAVGLLISVQDGTDGILITVFVIVAILAPSISAAFSSLLSLFQWDRLSTIYQDTLNSIYIADALSPNDHEESDKEYYTQMMAFFDSTLEIMKNESTQFGSLVQSVEETDKFVENSRKRAEQVSENFTATFNESQADNNAEG